MGEEINKNKNSKNTPDKNNPENLDIVENPNDYSKIWRYFTTEQLENEISEMLNTSSSTTSTLKIDTDSHYSNKLSESIKTSLKQEFIEFDQDYPADCEILDSWMFVNPIKFPNSDDRI